MQCVRRACHSLRGTTAAPSITRTALGLTRPLNRRSAAVMAAAAGQGAVPAVVSPQWLSEQLGRPDVKVLDVSWYLPPMGRDKLAEHAAGRIPGARFWDIDGVCDPNTDLPHMLPSEAAFAAAADALGISNADTVVVYDGMGLFAAPRAWWTWKVFGHDKVAVLEGGLPAWRAAGLQIEEGAVAEERLHAATAAAKAAAGGKAGSTSYKAVLQRDKGKSLDQMRTLVAAGPGTGPNPQVADARPPGRFKGVDPEPRAGLRGGHMPGAKNVPFPQLYVDGTMAGAKLKSPEELKAAFAAAGIDPSRDLVCTCGSGLTACILALGVHQATGGAKLPAVYDGSWSEWGAYPDTPISTD